MGYAQVRSLFYSFKGLGIFHSHRSTSNEVSEQKMNYHIANGLNFIHQTKYSELIIRGSMEQKIRFEMGLKRKLLLPLLLTVLAGMLIVVVKSYYDIKTHIKKLALSKLEATVDSMALSISEFVLINKRLNLAWSQNNFVKITITD